MITIKKISTRSLEENNYYHAVVVSDIASFRGWSTAKAHEWIKDTWNIESTASLNTFEFENLMEKIRTFCLKDWGLEISLPVKKII